MITIRNRKDPSDIVVKKDRKNVKKSQVYQIKECIINNKIR